MRVPAADRVDRRFWLVDRDGERHFPIRIPRKGDASDCRFRVSNAGNTLADGLEVETIEEVQTLVVGKGYSVRAVPESDPSKPPSLLKLNARKVLSWGSEGDLRGPPGLRGPVPCFHDADPRDDPARQRARTSGSAQGHGGTGCSSAGEPCGGRACRVPSRQLSVVRTFGTTRGVD